MGEEPKPQQQQPKERTCRTCGSALHSDLSRVMGQCGPCRVGDDQVGVRDWGHIVVPPPEEAVKTE
jgi:hypothetical protein